MPKQKWKAREVKNAPEAVISSETLYVIAANNTFSEKYGKKGKVIGLSIKNLMVKRCGNDDEEYDGKRTCVIKNAIKYKKRIRAEILTEDTEGKTIFTERIATPAIFNKKPCIFYREEDITTRKYTELQKKIITTILHIQANSLQTLLERMLEVALSPEIPWLSEKLNGAIFLTRKKKKKKFLSLTAGKNLNNKIWELCKKLQMGECLCGTSAQKREVQFVSSADNCEHTIRFEKMGPHGHYVLPMIHNGRLFGVVNFYTPKGHKYDQYIETFLQSVVDIITTRVSMFEASSEIEEGKNAIKKQLEVEQCFRKNHPIAIYKTTQEGRIIELNPAGYKLLGISQQDLQFVRIMDFLVRPKEREIFLKKINNQDVVKNHPMDMKNTQEVIMHCLITARKLKDPNGNITYEGSIVDDSERHHLMLQLEEQATFDPLTSLPNRRLFFTMLKSTIARASRNNEVVAVFSADLDGFKQCNDRYGHNFGDKLIKAAGRRFSECLKDDRCVTRKTDDVARLGGDEFAITLPNVKNRENTKMVAQVIINAFKLPFVINKISCKLGVTIGIALHPNDSDSAKDAYDKADKALIKAKKIKKGTYLFHEDP